MRVRELYDAALIEINKLEAPSMLLEDYNYLINKAIQQKINKSYNLYEMNQQVTDDLLALKRTSKLEIEDDGDIMPNELKGYYAAIPDDYWHMLNCVVQFNDDVPGKCGSSNFTMVARRLTSDLFPTVINNAYFKPNPKNPYYRIVKNSSGLVSSTLNSIVNPCNDDSVNNLLDLRFGDTSRYTPVYAYIDYLKTPDYIQLTHDDLVEEIDNTPVMEFPDYICYEIINEFVKLLLENSSDPRLQTNVPINQTIGYTMSQNN